MASRDCPRIHCHIGCQEEFRSGHEQVADAGLGLWLWAVGQLLVVRTPWVALSVDPTSSAAQREKRDRCVGAGAATACGGGDLCEAEVRALSKQAVELQRKPLRCWLTHEASADPRSERASSERTSATAEVARVLADLESTMGPSPSNRASVLLRTQLEQTKKDRDEKAVEAATTKRDQWPVSLQTAQDVQIAHVGSSDAIPVPPLDVFSDLSLCRSREGSCHPFSRVRVRCSDAVQFFSWKRTASAAVSSSLAFSLLPLVLYAVAPSPRP